MQSPLAALAAVFVQLGLIAGVASAAEPPAVAFTHVTVIDVRGGLSRPDMTVVVRDGRIASVAPSGQSAPRGAAVVDGRGKYLIPGLWDMHVHLSYAKASALPLELANGVTGVRDMGGELRQIDGWQAQIGAGALDGPRIVRAGPMLNGRSFNPYQLAVTTPEEARVVVRTLKIAGVDFIKTHRRTPREAFFAAVDEAKKQGLDLVGHIPMSVTPAEASNAGMATVEHVETLFEGTFSANLSDDGLPPAIARFVAAGDADALFKRFAANRTALTPTIVAWASDARTLDATSPPDPALRYIAASGRRMMGALKLSPSDVAAARARVAQFIEVVRVAHADHVMLLAGTDTGPTRPPGVLLPEELGYLVRAGLTPLEALQTATLNPATALHKTDDLGAVETGKLADLVLLDADPLADIGAVTRISAVVAAGRLYLRRDLDRLRDEGVRLAAAS